MGELLGRSSPTPLQELHKRVCLGQGGNVLASIHRYCRKLRGTLPASFAKQNLAISLAKQAIAPRNEEVHSVSRAIKVLVELFQKAPSRRSRDMSWARSPCRPSQRAKYSLAFIFESFFPAPSGLKEKAAEDASFVPSEGETELQAVH